jgi:hypothetical protein
MTACSTPETALAFVREHGVVLVSAKGQAPRLTDAIVGETVKGSWWAHAQGRLIFSILGAVSASDDILVCRFMKGKVTLWPALVCLADRFEPAQLAQVREEHTPSGRHANTEIPFPAWVPADVLLQGRAMDPQEAGRILADWLPSA